MTESGLGIHGWRPTIDMPPATGGGGMITSLPKEAQQTQQKSMGTSPKWQVLRRLGSEGQQWTVLKSEAARSESEAVSSESQAVGQWFVGQQCVMCMMKWNNQTSSLEYESQSQRPTKSLLTVKQKLGNCDQTLRKVTGWTISGRENDKRTRAAYFSLLQRFVCCRDASRSLLNWWQHGPSREKASITASYWHPSPGFGHCKSACGHYKKPNTAIRSIWFFYFWPGLLNTHCAPTEIVSDNVRAPGKSTYGSYLHCPQVNINPALLSIFTLGHGQWFVLHVSWTEISPANEASANAHIMHALNN